MKKHVLIADDEPNILLSLEFLLTKAGFEVTVVEDGQQVLEKARALRPDAILLDVMMPRKNGYEVCQVLREDPDFAGVKIVMLTAKGRETEIAKGLAIGADAYVTKPFGTRELVDKVVALLREAPDG